MRIYRYCLMLTACTALFFSAVFAAENCVGEDSFTLWQLPSQGPTQMMSYVILTPEGKLIVLDGGMKCDAPYLREFIAVRASEVELWIITHPHLDHMDALGVLFDTGTAPKINKLLASFPELSWVKEYCSDEEYESFRAFSESLTQSGVPCEDAQPDQKFKIDRLEFHVLGIRNPELTHNPLNNSSLVIRVSDGVKSVLFLGDLGLEGGEKLLKSPLAGSLPSEYVQMAHHGQAGVGESFYQKVNPSYCLWTTPKWLWDNDRGEGPGTGPYKTLETRAWMDKLPIKKHYIMYEGLQEIN